MPRPLSEQIEKLKVNQARHEREAEAYRKLAQDILDEFTLHLLTPDQMKAETDRIAKQTEAVAAKKIDSPKVVPAKKVNAPPELIKKARESVIEIVQKSKQAIDAGGIAIKCLQNGLKAENHETVVISAAVIEAIRQLVKEQKLDSIMQTGVGKMYSWAKR